ncbi:hypothetical protein [Burkholderia phage BCSR5]|nr:hypothetical protein [Burkholderia phage BCSR5]
MAARQFVVAAESFDIYSNGNLSTDYPWFITNAALTPQININAGAFNQGALTMPTVGAPAALTSGAEYQFPSTMQLLRGSTLAGTKSLFAFSGWLNVNNMGNGNGTLLGLGSTLNSGVAYPLLNISQSATSGLNLQFVTNINSPTSTPFNFNLALNTYYWITLAFSFEGTAAGSGSLKASYFVNDTPLLQNQQIAWTSDIFIQGQPANRLKLYGANFINYFWDDWVIQCVSSADPEWPAPATVQPDVLPHIPARHIQVYSAVGPGSHAEWQSDAGEPNWQAATDPTGLKYVVANDLGLRDTYKWSGPAMNDIRGVVLRSASQRYQNVIGVSQPQGATDVKQPTKVGNGPSHAISVLEDDGTNQWTSATLAAAEFGLLSK